MTSAVLITFGSLVVLGCIGYCTYRSFMDRRELEMRGIQRGWREGLLDAYYAVRADEEFFINVLVYGDIAPYISAAIVQRFLPDWKADLPFRIRRNNVAVHMVEIELQNSYEVQRIHNLLFAVLRRTGWESPAKKDLEEEYFERTQECTSS